MQTNDLEFINNTQLSNFQFAESEASKTTGMIPTIGYSNTTVTANAYNYSLMSVYNVTNINITKNCSSSTLNTQTDLFVTIKNSATGDINFTQAGSSNATCTSTNSAKISNYNTLVSDQTAKSTAKQEVKGLAGLFLIIILIVLILVPLLGKVGGGGGEK